MSFLESSDARRPGEPSIREVRATEQWFAAFVPDALGRLARALVASGDESALDWIRRARRR